MLDEAARPLDREQIFDIARAELTSRRGSWGEALTHDLTAAPSAAEAKGARSPQSSDAERDLHRGLAHVFTVLGLVLEREPLTIAHRAFRSGEPALRGTALEYLEVVLPVRVREVLLPLVGEVAQPASGAESPRKRDSRALADALLRSSPALRPHPRG